MELDSAHRGQDLLVLLVRIHILDSIGVIQQRGTVYSVLLPLVSGHDHFGRELSQIPHSLLDRLVFVRLGPLGVLQVSLDVMEDLGLFVIRVRAQLRTRL